MRVLALGSHPDDIELGCGGTLLKHKEKGDSLVFVVATHGEQGSFDKDPCEMVQIRNREARASARHYGAELIFLGLADGLTSFSLEEKKKLIKMVRDFKPDFCYIHGAQDHFPDHKIIHELGLSAITGAGGPWYQEVGGKPHKVKKILGYEVWHPLNRWQKVVDITETLHGKVRSLEEHQSQLENVDYDRAARGLALYRGAMAGKGAAEVFEVILDETD